MLFYLVIEAVDYEGVTVISAHDSFKEAQSKASRLNDANKSFTSEYRVIECNTVTTLISDPYNN